jgi:hypothetical protein
MDCCEGKVQEYHAEAVQEEQARVSAKQTGTTGLDLARVTQHVRNTRVAYCTCVKTHLGHNGCLDRLLDGYGMSYSMIIEMRKQKRTDVVPAMDLGGLTEKLISSIQPQTIEANIGRYSQALNSRKDFVFGRNISSKLRYNSIKKIR